MVILMTSLVIFSACVFGFLFGALLARSKCVDRCRDRGCESCAFILEQAP